LRYETEFPVGLQDDQIVAVEQKDGDLLIQYGSGALVHVTRGRCSISLQQLDSEPLATGSGFVWDRETQKFWGYVGFDYDSDRHIMRSYQYAEGFVERDVDLELPAYSTPIPVSTAQGLFLVYASYDGDIRARGLDSQSPLLGNSDGYFYNVKKAWVGPRGESIIAIATARCTAKLVRIPLVTE
jgi:hypothetical protein